MSVGYVGYSCISGSLSCALGCVGTSRAKTSGVDLYAAVVYFCSVLYSVHLATWVLGMRIDCCTMGICYRFTLELSGLNLGSGSYWNVTHTGLCECRVIQFGNEFI